MKWNTHQNEMEQPSKGNGTVIKRKWNTHQKEMELITNKMVIKKRFTAIRRCCLTCLLACLFAWSENMAWETGSGGGFFIETLACRTLYTIPSHHAIYGAV